MANLGYLQVLLDPWRFFLVVQSFPGTQSFPFQIHISLVSNKDYVPEVIVKPVWCIP